MAGTVRARLTVIWEGVSFVSEFVHLHLHSEYSLLDGAARIGDAVAAAAEMGMPALAITDHNGLYGAVRFARAAKEAGVSTIFGAEVTLGQDTKRQAHPDPPGEHLVGQRTPLDISSYQRC